mmetsp:Transcript_34980/g.108296  ORF Transcript_34980/g.108296 Transcript_34980/m.108296 type:complete len:236 (-) Transcript_34980:197-904(-)
MRPKPGHRSVAAKKRSGRARRPTSFPAATYDSTAAASSAVGNWSWRDRSFGPSSHSEKLATARHNASSSPRYCREKYSRPIATFAARRASSTSDTFFSVASSSSSAAPAVLDAAAAAGFFFASAAGGLAAKISSSSARSSSPICAGEPLVEAPPPAGEPPAQTVARTSTHSSSFVQWSCFVFRCCAGVCCALALPFRAPAAASPRTARTSASPRPSLAMRSWTAGGGTPIKSILR